MLTQLILQVYEYSPTALLIYGLGIVLFVTTIMLVFGITKKKGFVFGLLIFVVAFFSILCLITSLFYKDTYTATPYNITNATNGNVVQVSGAYISSLPFATDKLASALAIVFSIVDAVLALISLFLFSLGLLEARQKRKYQT